MPWW